MTPTMRARILSGIAICVVLGGILMMGFAEELAKWHPVELFTSNFFRALALFFIALGSGQSAELTKALIGRAKDIR